MQQYIPYTSNGMSSQYKNKTTNIALGGFQSFECYMLVKFGKGNFGVGGQSEYLLELPIYPEQVSESITPNWQTQSVLGRSSALSTYAGTSLKSVNFTLDLHRDLLTGSYSLDENDLRSIASENKESYETVRASQAAGMQYDYKDGKFDGRTWYVNANKMLQLACYPQYTTSGAIPPTTYFIFGQMILKGYLTSYQTTWKKPILNSFYGWNSVSISMECYPDSIIGAKEIIDVNYGANSSTQNTYNTKFPTSYGIASNVMNRSATSSRPNIRTDSSLGGSPIRT